MLLSTEEYFIMAIGGNNARYDVELLSLDPVSHPVPDCLMQLNSHPEDINDAAGALDYSGKTILW